MSSDPEPVQPTHVQSTTERKVGWVYWWLLGTVLLIGIWSVFGTQNCRASDPRWSPNGKEIAFTCSTGVDVTAADIYVANIESGNRWRNLTNNAGQRYDSFPVWSPDGTRIAFELDLNDIAVIGLNGGEITNLTSDLPVREGLPVWSPNGKRIAFAASLESSNDYNSTLIYVMNADGSDLQELANGPGHVSTPRWSPDGQKIAFLSFGADEIDKLIIMDVEGSKQNILADNLKDARDIAWSPNGQLHALADLNGIELIGINGKDRNRILTLGDELADWKKWGVFPYVLPAWSPDGEQLAVAYGGSHLAEIWIVNTSDARAKQLTQWTGAIMNLAWSPDGRSILFESDDDCSSEFCQGKAGVFILDTNGIQVRALKAPFPFLPALLLLLPQLAFILGLRSPNLFVRRHTQQAVLLAALNIGSLFALALIFYSFESFILSAIAICGWIPLQGIVLLLSTIWGVRQVKRGDCWFMRLRSEGNALPRPWAVR